MVGTPHGWACLDRAQTSCSARSSHARLAQHDAPRVMCSAFEGECGTLFDVQTSLTVVYDAPKPPHDTRSQHSAQVSLQLPYTGVVCARSVKIVTKGSTYGWTLSKVQYRNYSAETLGTAVHVYRVTLALHWAL